MTTLQLDHEPQIERVTVSPAAIQVWLKDGRILCIPTGWYPRIAHGMPREWENYRLIGQGHGVHWPDLDEDISIENLLEGRRSQESDASFKRWLDDRARLRPVIRTAAG